jgi:hypothetical protein
MKLRLLLFPLLFFLAYQVPVFAQSSFRVIGILPQIEQSFPADFYISSVEDLRTFRANIGIVNRGVHKSNKRPVLPKSGFWKDIEVRMSHWVIPNSGAEPVAVKVEELYLWEDRQTHAVEGHVRLRLRFVPQGKAEATTVNVTVSGEELLVSEGHAPRLEAAFFKGLAQYREIRSSEQTHMPFVEASAKAPSPRQLWGADNFLDLYKGTLRPVYTELQYKKNTNVGHFTLRKARRQPFYALVKGDDWFLKANTYFGEGDYYTLVLEKGRYLFLIDEEPAQGWGHLRMEREADDRRVGILIDMNTGIPQVVDDQLINQLMAPYPDLQKQYLFKDIRKYPFQLNRVRNVIAAINLREENS